MDYIPELYRYEDWIAKTKAIGRRRSREFRALDDTIRLYERFPSRRTLLDVALRFQEWKLSKGINTWMFSVRNKNGMMHELAGKLGQIVETQVPAYMRPDMDNARKGILYLFGNTEIDTNIFSLVVQSGINIATAGAAVNRDTGASAAGLMTENTGTNIGTLMIPGGAVLDGADTALLSATGEDRQLGNKLVAWLRDLAEKLIATMAEKFGDYGLTIKALKNLINVLASVLLKAAAPFIKSGMDIVSGLTKAGAAAVQRFKAWSHGKGVSILAGHPSEIISAIKRAMTTSIFEGLYTALKGIGDLAMDGLSVLSAGATVVAKVVVAAVEALIKVIWRLYEIFMMKSFFREANDHWQRRDSEAFHRNFVDFNRWYKGYCLKVPTVAMLTLNSGICGDKMRFLNMFENGEKKPEFFAAGPANPAGAASPGGRPRRTDAQQAVFDADAAKFGAGVKYVDELKSYGSGYLQGTGYNFHSGDPMVQALVGGGGHIYSHASPPTWADHVIKVVTA